MGRSYFPIGVLGMSDTMTVENEVTADTEFSVDNFRRNAKLYVKHKRAVDAIAAGISRKDGYDNFEDAIAQLSAVWEVLREQVANGGRYTPPVEMGFGSSNAAQVASAITGDKQSVTEIRKSFAAVGK